MSGLEVSGPAVRRRIAPGTLVVDDDGALARALRSPTHEVVVRLDGRRLDRLPMHRRVAAGLAVVGAAEIAPDVSVEDHLAAIVGAAEARRRLGDAPLLSGRGEDPAGVLSGGERLVLDWLRADALDPRAVLLDGAGAGLDAPTRSWCGRQVDRWLAAGVAVVLRPLRPEEREWARSTGGAS